MIGCVNMCTYQMHVCCTGVKSIKALSHFISKDLAWLLKSHLAVACSSRTAWWSTGWTVFVKQCWKGSGLQLEEVTMPTQWLLSIPQNCWTVLAQLQNIANPVYPLPQVPALKKSTISQHRCQRWRSMYEKRSLQWKSKTYVYFYCPRTRLRLRVQHAFSASGCLLSLLLPSHTCFLVFGLFSFWYPGY